MALIVKEKKSIDVFKFYKIMFVMYVNKYVKHVYFIVKASKKIILLPLYRATILFVHSKINIKLW